MKRSLWAILIMAVSANLSAPFFTVYQTHFNLNNAALSALFAVYAACLLPSLLVAGPLGDTLGPKPIAITGVIFALVSAGLFADATNLWELYLARAAEGLALGAFMGSGNALLLQKTPADRTSVVLTWSSMFTMIGFGLGPAISGMILEYVSWHSERLPYWILLAMLITVAISLFTITGQNQKSSEQQHFRIQLGIPFSGRQLYWTFIGPSVFLLFSLNGTVISLIPTYVKTVLHSDNLAWSGLLILLLLGGGGFAQRITKPNQPVKRVQIGIVFLLIGAWLMIMAGPFKSTFLLWIGMAIQALGSGWTFQGGMQLIGKMATKADHSKIMSTFYVAAYLGMILPTLGVGLISTIWGLVPALIVLGVLVTLLGIGIIRAPHRFSAPSSNESFAKRG